jgi:hypothetical protein
LHARLARSPKTVDYFAFAWNEAILASVLRVKSEEHGEL